MMTREEIEKMQRGRDLDALVAKRFFRLPKVQFYCGELIHTRTPIPFCGAPIVEHYSCSYEGFWKIWEKLVKRERYPTMHEGPDESGETCVWLSITNPFIELVASDAKEGLAKIALLSTFDPS